MTREEAIKILNIYLEIDKHTEPKIEKVIKSFEMAIDALKADTVEMVRCKECKEWNEYARDKLGRCDCHLITTSADDFCSYGERSEE